jgi:hypothetical protein
MVIDDERLTPPGEGSELVKVGVLDRLGAVRWYLVWPWFVLY